jgi:hypothetical protein
MKRFTLILALLVAAVCWMVATPTFASGFGQRIVSRQRVVVERQRVVVRQQPIVVQRQFVHSHAFVQPFVVRQQFVQPYVVQPYIVPQAVIVQPQAFVTGCQSAAFFAY